MSRERVTKEQALETCKVGLITSLTTLVTHSSDLCLLVETIDEKISRMAMRQYVTEIGTISSYQGATLDFYEAAITKDEPEVVFYKVDGQIGFVPHSLWDEWEANGEKVERYMI